MADFTVLKLQGPGVCKNSGGHLHNEPTELKFSLFDNFKINLNDYSTLRHMLVQDKEVSGVVTLSAMEELLKYSCHDLSAFLDLKWLIYNKLSAHCPRDCRNQKVCLPAEKRRRLSTDGKLLERDGECERWVRLCVECVRNHYCMSWSDYVCSVNQINQWLLAISTEFSLKMCLCNFQLKKTFDSKISTTLNSLLNSFNGRFSSEIVANAISSKLLLLSDEVYALQLKVVAVSEPSLVDNPIFHEFLILSWQDALFLVLCLKRLDLHQLSNVAALHIWNSLHMKCHMFRENLSPGIFWKNDNGAKRGKQTLKRIDHLKRRLKKLLFDHNACEHSDIN